MLTQTQGKVHYPDGTLGNKARKKLQHAFIEGVILRKAFLSAT